MASKDTKYIFVTGGVLSGVGKGITAASIGSILKSTGLSVNIQKCDPYLNMDAGTLNPAEHGEVFVTADGAETDLDLGHYERFLDQELNKHSSLMSGRILNRVIKAERAGKYLGKTVQIIPHVTDTIQDEIEKASEGYDVHIVEIGGTVGDYEGLSFIEAIREFKQRAGRENVMYVHVVYMPYVRASREVKTKPAQNAVRILRGYGINPDVLVARTEEEVKNGILDKLSMFADVPKSGICIAPTVSSVYEVPLIMDGITKHLATKLGLELGDIDLKHWKKVISAANNTSLPTVKIGVVAKYMDHEDTYMSVFEAVKSAAWNEGLSPEIVWIDAEKAEKRLPIKELESLDGIVVPGGFGSRGVEGKIRVADWAMNNNKPYLGLCLGMQVAAIALARKAIDSSANSTEFDSSTNCPVVSLMEEQEDVVDLGGTMRLGNWECHLEPSSIVRSLYRKDVILERHRHRYEFNNKYRQQLESAGMVFSGLSPDKRLVEVIELKDHPFFVASQFHPEYTSRPGKPNPLFKGFIKAAKSK